METVHSYRHDGWTLVWALLLSIGLQGMIAVYFGVVSQALDSPIPLIYFFLFYRWSQSPLWRQSHSVD